METNVKEFQAPPELISETLTQVTEELHGESERACAIVGGALLDDLLGELLEAYLVQNSDASSDLLSSENINAPLGSFGARIVAAYTTGLLPKSNFNALRKVKRIRNQFAHDLSLGFNEPGISRLCAGLSTLTKKYHDAERTPRQIFEDTVAYLAGGLRELLYLTKELGLKGSFRAVVRLASGYKSGKGPG